MIRVGVMLLFLQVILQENPDPDWEAVVPIGMPAQDIRRLSSQDGEAAIQAYDAIYAARQPSGAPPLSRIWALDLKCLRDGAPLLKRHVLSKLEVRDVGPRRAGVILDGLLKLDEAGAPFRMEDLEVFPATVILSLRVEHEGRLKALGLSPHEALRRLGQYGLAVLGEVEARKSTLRDFKKSEDWKLGASARVMARAPDPDAIGRLRELLRTQDRYTLRAAFAALPGFPDVDVKAELSAVLELQHAEIQTLALRAIASRGIDLSERVLELYSTGKIVVIERDCGFSPPPPFQPLVEVGVALLAGDDPALFDRLPQIKENSISPAVALITPHWDRVLPKIRDRLRGLAAGKEGPGKLASIGSSYLESRLKSSESVDEVLDLIEACGFRKNFSHIHTALFYADPATPAQKERLFKMCRGWLGQEGHPLRFGAGLVLHRWGVKEAEEDLLKVARAGGREGMRCLGILGVTPETRPLILEQAKGHEPYVALYVLAKAKDEEVISLILREFKAGRSTLVGGRGGLAGHLKEFDRRDLTDDLLACLDDNTHQAHIASILSYLRWRGRKDKVELFRKYLSHPYGFVLDEAAGGLADWKDSKGFEAMESQLKGADSERQPRLLHAMMRLDRSRAEPHFRAYVPVLLRSRHWERFEELFPTPADRRFVIQILMTEPMVVFGSESLEESRFPRVAGKILGPAVVEPLLALAEDGHLGAATGLAYTGDPRALAAVTPLLGPKSPVELLNALDFLVHGGGLPKPGTLKTFVPGPRTGEAAAKEIEDAFGVAIDFAGLLPPREVRFVAEQDFLESMERLGAGRYPRAHVTQDGKVRMLLLKDARAYWLTRLEK